MSEQSLKSRWQQAITQNGNGLNPNAMRVAFYVSVRAKLDGTNDQPPRQTRIADELGTALSNVERGIRDLVKTGWLTKGRGHVPGFKGSEYVLTFPSQVKASASEPVAGEGIDPSPVKASGVGTGGDALAGDAKAFTSEGIPSPVKVTSLQGRRTNMSLNMSPTTSPNLDPEACTEPEVVPEPDDELDNHPLTNFRRRVERSKRSKPRRPSLHNRIDPDPDVEGELVLADGLEPLPRATEGTGLGLGCAPEVG